MRAVVITKFGGPEVLELKELPNPEPPFGHVRIAVRFAGVNRADVVQRLGHYPAPPGVPKDIPGLEYSGVVDALGPGATRFAVGNRVFGLVAGGAYADKLVAHEREVVKIPAHVDDLEAAAIPEAFVTAFDALVVRGRLGAGDVALIHAAGSGVGTAGVPIAGRLGATVIGTSRTQSKLDRCKPLGLDHGILPEKGAFADAVLKASAGHGADVVLDLVGGAYVTEELKATAELGRIVVVGLTNGREAPLDLGLLMRKRATIVGTMLRSRPLEEKIEAAKLLGDRIAPLFEDKSFRAVLDQVMPLAEAGAAHTRMVENEGFGKILPGLRRGPMSEVDPAGMALILRALHFAADKRRFQRRKDEHASPYINHPIDLANCLANEAHIADPIVIAAAILHDTVEDTETTFAEIEEHFGPEIRAIVGEVTDDKALPKADRKHLQIEHAPRATFRAQQLKFADKICNVRDVAKSAPSGWSLDRQREYFDWAKRVVDQMRGPHQRLAELFDEAYQLKP